MESLDVEERDLMLAYWKEHAGKSGSSMENMMLDKNASKLDLLDRPEVLSLLPSFRGARVLEMASGIGRFTGVFAQSASSVVTVEFVPEFLEKNRELNQHHSNVTFLCEDVLRLGPALAPASAFDLVFSCWLQMYLSDDEVRSLARKCLEWCSPGGHVFFRESCFRQSGDAARSFNPSHYRHPSFYTQLFSSLTSDDGAFGLELVMVRNLRTYVEVKGNKGQICWLFKKVPLPRPPHQQQQAPATSSSSLLEGPAAAAREARHGEEEGEFSVTRSPVLAGSRISRRLWSQLQQHLQQQGEEEGVEVKDELLLLTPASTSTSEAGAAAAVATGGSPSSSSLRRGGHVLEVGACCPTSALWLAEEQGHKLWVLERGSRAAEACIERAMGCQDSFVVVEGRPGLRLGGRGQRRQVVQAGSMDCVRLWEALPPMQQQQQHEEEEEEQTTTSSSDSEDDQDQQPKEAAGEEEEEDLPPLSAALARAVSWLKPGHGRLLATAFVVHRDEQQQSTTSSKKKATSSSRPCDEEEEEQEQYWSQARLEAAAHRSRLQHVTVQDHTDLFVCECERSLALATGTTTAQQQPPAAAAAGSGGQQEAAAVWRRRLSAAKEGRLRFVVLMGRAPPTPGAHQQQEAAAGGSSCSSPAASSSDEDQD